MADESNPNFSGCHWEAMTLGGEPYHNLTSLVHAWSTGPVHLWPRYIAGLRAVAPGWRKWEARPLYAGLDKMHASVPTPARCVEIEWRLIRTPAVLRFSVQLQVVLWALSILLQVGQSNVVKENPHTWNKASKWSMASSREV